MKTAEEILFSITNREDVSIDECLDAMNLYAEQFIDLAADEVWKISYSTEKHYNKNEILKLKELIK